MSDRSVRPGLINWLGRVIDHLSKKAVEVLRGGEVHSHPVCDLNDLIVTSIPHDAPMGEIDNAHVMSGFQQNINELNRNAVVSDFQPLLGHRQELAGPNHYLISQQNLPQQEPNEQMLALLNGRVQQ